MWRRTRTVQLYLCVSQQCSEQFEKLEKLHKELESVKKSIELQVIAINDKIRREGNNLKSLWRKGSVEVEMMDVSLGGATVGKDNILRALHFLSQLCAGSGEGGRLLSRSRLRDEEDDTRSQSNSCSVSIKQENEESDDEEDDQPKNIDLVVKSEVLADQESYGSPEEDEYMLTPSKSTIPTSTSIAAASSSSATNNLYWDWPTTTASSSLAAAAPQRDYQKTTQCPICKKILSEKTRMSIHMRTRTGEKPYQCDCCDKRFAQWNSLEIHKRVHLGEKKFKCERCKEGFTHRQALITSHRKNGSCLLGGVGGGGGGQ